MSSIDSNNIQIEFVLSKFELPNRMSLLKEKLIRFGIDLTYNDQLFLIDAEGDKVIIDEDNISYISKHTQFDNALPENKFILVKYEKPEKIILDSQEFNYVINKLGIPKVEDISQSLTRFPEKNLEFCDNELEKLLDSFQTKKENKNNNDNININFESVSFGESVILSPDICFQTMYKKYINDLLQIVNKYNSNSNSNSENEFQKFYDYLNQPENFNYLLENFTPEEIKQSKDVINSFHNLLVNFNEFKNKKINEMLKAIKNNYDKLKVFELSIRDERRKVNDIKEMFEMNKGFFNKFMIEVQDHIQDLRVNLNIDNFEPNNFDNNLNKLFSFIVKISLDLNNLQQERNNEEKKILALKSDKYFNNDGFKICSKHSFCTQNSCPFQSKESDTKLIQHSSIKRFMSENIYKNDNLYDV